MHALGRVYDLAESWLALVRAGEAYVQSVSDLIDGKITTEEQEFAFDNYIEAGSKFRKM